MLSGRINNNDKIYANSFFKYVKIFYFFFVNWIIKYKKGPQIINHKNIKTYYSYCVKVRKKKFIMVVTAEILVYAQRI